MIFVNHLYCSIAEHKGLVVVLTGLCLQRWSGRYIGCVRLERCLDTIRSLSFPWQSRVFSYWISRKYPFFIKKRKKERKKQDLNSSLLIKNLNFKENYRGSNQKLQLILKRSLSSIFTPDQTNPRKRGGTSKHSIKQHPIERTRVIGCH